MLYICSYQQLLLTLLYITHPQLVLLIIPHMSTFYKGICVLCTIVIVIYRKGKISAFLFKYNNKKSLIVCDSWECSFVVFISSEYDVIFVGITLDCPPHQSTITPSLSLYYLFISPLLNYSLSLYTSLHLTP